MLDLTTWWRNVAGRLPLPGKIVDYAVSVQRYNRALNSRPNIGAIGAALTLPVDTNRVGLIWTLNFTLQTTVTQVVLSALGQGAVALWQHTLLAKQVDTGAVTPSAAIFAPFSTTVLEFGPLIQGGWSGSASTGVIHSALELLVNPELSSD